MALELVARGVGAAALAAGERAAGAERGTAAVLLLVGRLDLTARARQRTDYDNEKIAISWVAGTNLNKGQ